MATVITLTKKKQIQTAITGLKQGKLQMALGLKKGQKIPTKLLERATRSKKQLVRRQALIAKMLKNF